jgi:hypothetical protein
MIYIGETDNLRRRIADHVTDLTHKMHLYRPESVCLEVITAGEEVRLSRQQALILEYDPPANHS